jgi:hypothetical protein
MRTKRPDQLGGLIHWFGLGAVEPAFLFFRPSRYLVRRWRYRSCLSEPIEMLVADACTDARRSFNFCSAICCEFRRKPAGDSDLIPARVPI